MDPQEFHPERVIYKVDRVAGRGHTSSVFKAVRLDSDGHSQQTVAFKVLKDKNAVQWLRREFETLTQIQSANCVKVLAWENLKTGPALVLEWIDGVNLIELIKADELRSHWADEIVAQIQQGLRDLDRYGFHHGDLSPANVLIDKSGCIRLVDFASGEFKSEGGLNNQIHGTPAYLSPERWKGSPTSLASDLFALGLIQNDIASGFNLSGDPALSAWELRANQFATEEGGRLLSLSPSDRFFVDAVSTPSIREEMAQAVSRIMAGRFLMHEKTRTIVQPYKRGFRERFLQGRRRRPLRHWAIPWCFSLLIAVVSVRAQAPRIKANEEKGSLVITSANWLHLELNGRNAGYAPLALENLRPGSHRLVWKTAVAEGEFRFFLPAGGHLRFSEKQLSRLE